MDWKYLSRALTAGSTGPSSGPASACCSPSAIVATILDAMLGLHDRRQLAYGIISVIYIAGVDLFRACTLRQALARPRQVGLVDADRAGAADRRDLADRRTRNSRRRPRRQQIRTGSSCLKKTSLSGYSSASRAASAARPIFSRACCSPSSRRSCSTASRWWPEGSTAGQGWAAAFWLVMRGRGLGQHRAQRQAPARHRQARPASPSCSSSRSISIIAFIALCLMPGEAGPNRYGQRPNAPAGTPDMSGGLDQQRHYRHLDPELIIETAETLEQRVGERFPDSGLRTVAQELIVAVERPGGCGQGAGGADLVAALLIALAIFAGAAMFLFVGTILSFDRISTDEARSNFVQGIEASLNTILLAGLGFIALTRSEERIKRKRVFARPARAALADPCHRHAPADQGSGGTVPRISSRRRIRRCASPTGRIWRAISTIVPRCCRSPASWPRCSPSRSTTTS